MSKEFQPSIASAKNALSDKIELRSHPAGAKGAAISLQEVAKKIREGRLDPRVRAWAGEVLIAAGKPSDPINQAQALLDVFRKKTMYGLDPVGAEFMVSAKNTLCLDAKGLCIRISDCDDLVIALGSALMSVGIPIQIVGQSFDSSNVPTHVLLAIQTDSGWKKIDPSHPTYKVGESHPGTHETWIDPMSTSPINFNGSGDFVGVGNIPPNQDSVITLGLGLADISVPTSEEVYNAVTFQFRTALNTLRSSVNSLGQSLHDIEENRKLLDPSKPFDPEPFTINGLNQFPTTGLWTKSMAELSTRIYKIGQAVVTAGDQALDGSRKLLLDKTTNEIYVEAKDQDPWRLHTVISTVTDQIIGFFSPIGQLVSGFSAKNATPYTRQQIDTQIVSGTVQGPLGVGAVPVVAIVAGITITAVAVSASIAYSLGKQADAATIAAKEASNRLAIECIASNKCPPDLLQKLGANRVSEAQAENQNNPLAAAAGSTKEIVKWIVIGGAVAAGIYVAAPTVKKLLEDATNRRRLTTT